MERVDELISILRRVETVVRQAAAAAHLVEPVNHGKIHPVMEFNNNIHRVLNSRASPAKWIDEALTFLLKELVPHDDDSIADKKLRLLYANVPNDSKHRAYELLTPLRKLLDEEDSLRSQIRRDPPVCLVLTALPVEFRAVIRRVKTWLSGTSILALTHALEEALDEDKDGRQPMSMECTLCNGNKEAKVIVMLPKGHGSPMASQEITRYLDKKGGAPLFKHVFVVGVAGHLDSEGKVGIGDVVMSNGFYDAHLRKTVVERMGEIDFANKKRNLFDISPPFALCEWAPRLFEAKPKGRYRFRQAHIGYVVSGPDLVKRRKYKKQLQNAFPDALAVEMEAAGCRWALEHHGTPITVVKSICDWSIHTKTATWHPYCADVAADLATDLICDLYGK